MGINANDLLLLVTADGNLAVGGINFLICGSTQDVTQFRFGAPYVPGNDRSGLFC